ncbi:MAG: hypothetical protein KDC44_04520 [Phaeodactylibacter sp.]|nr:hypothetical protein [Phaeodactylibacter sp.]
MGDIAFNMDMLFCAKVNNSPGLSDRPPALTAPDRKANRGIPALDFSKNLQNYSLPETSASKATALGYYFVKREYFWIYVGKIDDSFLISSSNARLRANNISPNLPA